MTKEKEDPMSLFKSKKPEDASGFKAGDECIVTGDTAGAGHEFEVGEQVSLDTFDAGEGTWKCQGANDYWWVFPDDLELVAKPPSDKELKAAMKSIQQSARNLKKT